MLEESLVVSSALSAFNNAALLAPAFLWDAVLCIPLFAVVFWFGRYAAPRLNISSYITVPRATFWTILITALWCVLFGGNYAVLRDGTSVLPWVLSGILFLSTLFIGGATRAIRLPLWYGAAATPQSHKWIINILVLLAILVPVAACNLQNLWVGLVQVLAICLGFAIGRWTRYQINGTFCLFAIMFGVTVAVLMQPEFFRFGQLGNLTPLHLLWILGSGISFAVAIGINSVRPSGRIHNSAYIKIKWLLRLLFGLCAVLFLLTESVPMFVSTVVFTLFLTLLSVRHAQQISPQLPARMLGLALVMFGVLIGTPTITCVGLLLLATNKNTGKFLPWFVL
jgi:hypothetical protein